jgi:hypothetical protein
VTRGTSPNLGAQDLAPAPEASRRQPEEVRPSRLEKAGRAASEAGRRIFGDEYGAVTATGEPFYGPESGPRTSGGNTGGTPTKPQQSQPKDGGTRFGPETAGGAFETVTESGVAVTGSRGNQVPEGGPTTPKPQGEPQSPEMGKFRVTDPGTLTPLRSADDSRNVLPPLSESRSPFGALEPPTIGDEALPSREQAAQEVEESAGIRIDEPPTPTEDDATPQPARSLRTQSDALDHITKIVRGRESIQGGNQELLRRIRNLSDADFIELLSERVRDLSKMYGEKELGDRIGTIADERLRQGAAETWALMQKMKREREQWKKESEDEEDK